MCSSAPRALTQRKRFRLPAASRTPYCLLALIVGLSIADHAQNSPAGRQQVLVSPFEAGATHVAGKYGFTNGNFLLEGANAIRQLGSPSIFIYLSPDFRVLYPDRGDHLWPDENPTSLVQLAQSTPFQSVLKMPFRTFVITSFSFVNADQINRFATDTNAAAAEEQEFYDLTKYLYATFAGSGKTFILKHWEGDWAGLQSGDTAADISPTMISAMTNWLVARQKGVSRGRNESGNVQGVAVLNAVEVNRIFDYSKSGLRRVINKVVPFVQADMVTYSSYDSSLSGTDSTSEATAMEQALSVINSLTPDPLALGSRRMLISEYGLYENERPTETIWRTQTILSTAKSAGLLGAFTWQVFDNECRDAGLNYFPAGSVLNTAIHPDNSQCRGLWLVRPDGSESTVVSLLSPYWSDASAPPPPPAPATGVTVLSPQNGATVPTNLRVVAFGTSAYPIIASAVYVDDLLFLKNYTNSVDTYVPLSAGWHNLVLQAWDSAGTVFKTPVNVNAILSPVSGFIPVLTVTPKVGLAPLTVTASTAQSLGSGLVSSINFGDGTVVSGPTASHTYKSIGNYRVTATVSDSSGNSGTTAGGVNVTGPPPPPPPPSTFVNINSPSGGQVSSPVHVSASTRSSASYVAMVLYVDGSPIYSTSGLNLDTYASMSAGTHSLLVQAWGRPNSGDELAFLASAAVSVSCPATPAPVFSLASGSYSGTQSLTITDSLTGAIIYYTTDGTTPTTSSTEYTGPITVSSTETIKAIAAATGYSPSAITTAIYTINSPAGFTLSASPVSVAVPQGGSGTSIILATDVGGFTGTVTLAAAGLPSGVSASFAPGSAAGTQVLTLTASTSAPITSSAVTVTITGASGSLSATTTVGLNITAEPGIPAPVFSLPAGSYLGTQSLTITDSPTGATIYYTNDGTTPTTSSTEYTGPITVSSTETIEAIAAATGYSTSAVTTAAYTINISAPGFTLYASPVSVSVPQGGSGTSTILATDVGGFTGTVALAATGLSSGVSASFAPGSAAGTQVLTLTASTSAPMTSSAVTVTITGTSGSLSATTTVDLDIIAQPGIAPGSGGTTSLTVTPGAIIGNTGPISVAGTNGFTGIVDLTCSVSTTLTGVNDMPTCSLNPTSVTISGAAAQTSTLTVNTTAASSAENQKRRLFWPSTSGATFALVLLFVRPRKRKDRVALIGLLLLFVSTGFVGCGGGSIGGGGGGGNGGTTPGAYTITVTGRSGSVSATVGAVALTVQ